MFSRDLDSLRIDPELHVAVRPFIEIESIGHDPPMTQYYFSKQDNGVNWQPGVILSNLDDEKVPGMQWKIVRRWFHVPAFQLTFTNDLSQVVDTTGQTPMAGNGPYVAMFKHMVKQIRTKYDQSSLSTS